MNLSAWAMFYHPVHPLRAEWFELVRRYRRAYGSPFRGSTRITFRNGDSVYKIPLNGWGVKGNYRELCLSTANPHRFARAWTHEITPGGLLVLAMEYLLPAQGLPRGGWWESIDSCQVGWSKDGLLKAYDFALS